MLPGGSPPSHNVERRHGSEHGRFADIVASGTSTFVFVGNDVGVVPTGEWVKGSDETSAGRSARAVAGSAAEPRAPRGLDCSTAAKVEDGVPLVPLDDREVTHECA